MIDFDKDSIVPAINATTRIKVVGVGGAGGNTINSMINQKLEKIDFIAANTDAQALQTSKAPINIQLGLKVTKGLGAGSNPDLGKRAAEEDLDTIYKELEGADIVFLVGGLGGGTGSGALPVIAQALKERSILTIAIVTLPFSFEGSRRAKVAEQAVQALQKNVDTLIVIPNQKLLDGNQKKVSLVNAFGMVNSVITQCIKSIYDIITNPGHINVDFADVKAILKDKGFAIMCSGRAQGENRALNAVNQALSSPLLGEHSIQGAQGILLNITGSNNLSLDDVEKAASELQSKAHPDANIIMGLVFDESEQDISITIIATGFERVLEKPKPTAPVHETKPEIVIKSAQEKQPSVVVAPQEASSAEAEADIEVPTILRRMVQEKQAQQKNN